MTAPGKTSKLDSDRRLEVKRESGHVIYTAESRRGGSRHRRRPTDVFTQARKLIMTGQGRRRNCSSNATRPANRLDRANAGEHL